MNMQATLKTSNMLHFAQLIGRFNLWIVSVTADSFTVQGSEHNIARLIASAYRIME